MGTVQSDSLFEQLSPLPHRLIHGDATRRGSIPKQSIDLIVTSPPYNIGKAYSDNEADDLLDYQEYLNFSRRWLANSYHWTKPTGRLCVNVGLDKNKDGKCPMSADITRIAMEVGWKYHATIIWNEGNISRRTAWGSWMSASAPHVIAPVETIIVLYKHQWKRNQRGENDIKKQEFMDWVLGMWQFNGENAKRVGHEAPFPRELPRRCIKLFSFIGNTVLDPFVGSGTTMIEAICNNRHAVGLEKENKYCKLARNRIAKLCGIRLDKTSAQLWQSQQD